jgi:hypothetical protein
VHLRAQDVQRETHQSNNYKFTGAKNSSTTKEHKIKTQNVK